MASKPRIVRKATGGIPPIDQYNMGMGSRPQSAMVTYSEGNPQTNAEKPPSNARDRLGQPIDQSIIDAIVLGVRDQIANLDPAHWFGPNQPLRPIAQEQAKGRLIDYASGYNLRQVPREEEVVSFDQLRALSNNCDVLRVVLETRKDQVEAVEWAIKIKDGYETNDEDDDQLIKLATEFFLHPSTELDWTGWIRTILEDLFVIDGVAIYPRWMLDGSLYSVDVLDAAMIKRVIDEGARTPLPPNPAYQQRVRGVLAVNYSADELFYFVRNPRSYKFYGYGPVEQIIVTVNTAIRKAIHQLQYYTEGNVPEAIAGVPETWTMAQIAEFQMYWDTLIEGNTAQRRHMKFMPLDPTKIKEIKPPELKDMYDEWLARIICFCFSVSPSQLVKDTNRATAETVAEQTRKEGLLPLLNFLRMKFNVLLARYLKMPQLEWHWDLEEEIDPATQAAIDQIYVTLKIRTPEEVRKDRFGLDALTDEEKESAWPTPEPSLGPDGKPTDQVTGPAQIKRGIAQDPGIKGPGGTEKMIGKLVIAPTINIPERSVTVGDVVVNADVGELITKLNKVGGK